MIFSCFKHCFIFFNVNEHLAVPSVELTRGGSHVDLLCFFCIHRITCWLLAFSCVCLYGWSNSQKSPSSNSPLRLFQGIICNINSVIPLIYWVSRFLKNHRRRDQDFLVKMGDNPFRGFVYRMRIKHCFSLIMYGFCSSNAFYLASLSFKMFITILN